MSLSWLLTNFIASILLPPINGVLPALVGLVLLHRRPRLGSWLIAVGLAVVTAASLPIVAKCLLQPLEERYPPLALASVGQLDVDAIVVLGSSRYRHAPEFDGQDDMRQLALERLRYGALLARVSGKPILLAGGKLEGEEFAESDTMARVLSRDFGVEARWLEGRSTNTRENARYSAEILLSQGIRRVALVTNAFHMPRAVSEFDAAGFSVVPAPTVFLAGSEPSTFVDWLPRYETTRSTGYGLHEWIGLLWYKVRN